MKFITALSLKVKIIIIACTVTAAAAVGAVIIVNSEDAYRVIKVFELNGSAVVTRENTGDIDAYAGMNLESGDTLSVEENSTLRISLDSDKYILLDGGTILNLIAQGTSSDSRTVIDLQEGTILNEIKNSLSANSSYEVNTPKATMAVRGTTFTVTTRENPDGSFVTELHTEEGTVSVQLFGKNGEPKGAEIYVPKGGAVTILTEVNDETGNPADVDGNPHFVFPNGDGTFTDCGNSDPVYYPDNNASAEAQTERTEQTVAAVPSDTSITETSEEYSVSGTTAASEAVIAVETEKAYSAADLPEHISITVPITTAVPVITAAPTEATTVPTTTVPAETTTVPAKTTVPVTTTVPKPTTVPTTTTVPIMTTVPTTTTTVPTTTTTVPTTTTTVPTATTTVPTTTTTESTTTTELPTVYKVNFVDENGNVISESEFDENETLGTLPQITDKKGYTGKWVSGGTEVTENTVISGDMEVTAEYTPRPVTVHIYAPYDNYPGSTYDSILTFTVLYDSNLSDNSEGYDIASLTQYVDSRYSDYYDTYGRDYALSSISFNGVPGSVSDASAISGDCVYEDGEQLYAIVYFNYEISDGN